jgi:hypothetical protein
MLSVNKEIFTPIVDEFEPLDKDYKVGYKCIVIWNPPVINCPYIPEINIKVKK